MILRKNAVTNNFLGMIIAVIAIVGLVFLGVRLYNVFVEQEDKNAQAFIDGLNAKIENLENGENNTFALRGVGNWVFVAFDFKDKTRPDKCFLNSCVCVCKDSSENCQEQGFCRQFEDNLIVNSYLKERTYFMGVLKSVDYSSKCVFLYSDLMPFFIDKKEDKIEVSVDYGILSDADGKYSELVYRKKDKVPIMREETSRCYVPEKINSPGYQDPVGIPGS
jgi:hypothetical protein